MPPRQSRIWQVLLFTWVRPLIDNCVEFGTQAFVVHRGRGRKGGSRNVRSHESPSPHGDEVAHRDTVAGNDERLSSVECTHDLSTLNAELALANFA